MASLTQCTWVWVNSRSWWWTGRPGVLRFMGSQRVGHDWVTELNWTERENSLLKLFKFFFLSQPRGLVCSINICWDSCCVSCTGLDSRVTVLNNYHLVTLCSYSWGDRNVTPFSFNCSVVLSVLLGKLNGKDFSETLLCHLRNQRVVFHLSEWLRWWKKEPACDAGDQGSIPGLGKFPGPSPSAFNLSQHQSLFKWVSYSHHVAKVLELQL